MARDHARVRLDIWTDDDWRDLTPGAQWLYVHLLTSPTLTFAGVADWRPARITGHAAGLTPDVVFGWAVELQAGEFVLIDENTEEALIRSFVKHDGLMRSPNMAKALARDHGTISSPVLRAVLVHQLKRLKRQDPDLKGWPHLAGVLRKRSMAFADGLAELSGQPSGKGSGKGSRPADVDTVTTPEMAPKKGAKRHSQKRPSRHTARGASGDMPAAGRSPATRPPKGSTKGSGKPSGEGSGEAYPAGSGTPILPSSLPPISTSSSLRSVTREGSTAGRAGA